MAVTPSVADPLQGHAKYQMRFPLSAGAFGFVNLYHNSHTHEDVAIKFLERGDRVTKYVEFEVLNHRILRHPHVIEFKEVFLTEKYVCIAMEYASGGSLFNFVQKHGRFKEAAARWFFQQLILGLDYCHKKGVVNRDIKLENTLLQKIDDIPLPLVKICDFGYSKSHVLSTPKSKVGTLAYMAPEVINGGQYDGKMADIWSCGIMLYVLLFGHYPFDTPAPPAGANPQVKQQRAQNMMMRILGMKWEIPADVPISAGCMDLLKRIIVPDPSQRLTMAQIQQHPWFLDNLPPEALHMNVQCLNDATACADVQSEEEIHAIMRLVNNEGNDFEDGWMDEIIQMDMQEAINQARD